MRTTGAVRRFTDDPLPDDVLERILDNARFAPSGGNRQGMHVIVVRDRQTREALVELTSRVRAATSRRPGNGEGTVESACSPCGFQRAKSWRPPRCPPYRARPLLTPACAGGLRRPHVVAAFDQYLDRIGVDRRRIGVPVRLEHPAGRAQRGLRWRAHHAWRWPRNRASRNCSASRTTTRSPPCCRSASGQAGHQADAQARRGDRHQGAVRRRAVQSRVLADVWIRSATGSHPRSSIMSCPMPGKNSASVRYACAVARTSA